MVNEMSIKKPACKYGTVVATARGWEVEETGELLVSDRKLLEKLGTESESTVNEEAPSNEEVEIEAKPEETKTAPKRRGRRKKASNS